MSRRKSSTDIGPVQSRLLTSRAALSPVEVDEPRHLAADPLDPAGHRLLGVQRPLAGVLGIADHAGRPADQDQRPVTGPLQVPGHDQLHQVAEVQAGRRRVEADVERDRPGVEVLRAAPPRRWSWPAGPAISVRPGHRSRRQPSVRRPTGPRPLPGRRLGAIDRCAPTPAQPPAAHLGVEHPASVRPSELESATSAELVADADLAPCRRGRRGWRSSPRTVSTSTHARGQPGIDPGQLLGGQVGQLDPVGLAAAYAGTGDVVRLGERHPLADQPVGDVGGQGEAPRRPAPPAARDGRSGWRPCRPPPAARSAAGRPSRRPAPCPPAGRGCRPAADPSAWPAGRSGCRSAGRPCPGPARPHRGSSSAA